MPGVAAKITAGRLPGENTIGVICDDCALRRGPTGPAAAIRDEMFGGADIISVTEPAGTDRPD